MNRSKKGCEVPPGLVFHLLQIKKLEHELKDARGKLLKLEAHLDAARREIAELNAKHTQQSHCIRYSCVAVRQPCEIFRNPGDFPSARARPPQGDALASLRSELASAQSSAATARSAMKTAQVDLEAERAASSAKHAKLSTQLKQARAMVAVGWNWNCTRLNSFKCSSRLIDSIDAVYVSSVSKRALPRTRSVCDLVTSKCIAFERTLWKHDDNVLLRLRLLHLDVVLLLARSFALRLKRRRPRRRRRQMRPAQRKTHGARGSRRGGASGAHGTLRSV
eukprot:6188243-Pleurochrysis_carterae.AAC.1